MCAAQTLRLEMFWTKMVDILHNATPEPRPMNCGRDTTYINFTATLEALLIVMEVIVILMLVYLVHRQRTRANLY